LPLLPQLAPAVAPKAEYDKRLRQVVLERIVEDAMSVEGVLTGIRRDFPLELSTGFVCDCLYAAVERLDMAGHRRQVLERFSGTPCVDELHLGRYTLLLATDPVADLRTTAGVRLRTRACGGCA